MTDLELEQKLKFVRMATRAMAEQTFSCVCSIAGIESADSGALVGTGFRLVDGDRRWLVTAHHVFTEAKQTYGRLAVTAVREQPPVELGSEPLVDPDADVAVFELPDTFPTVSAWPLGRVERASAQLDTDFLFVHGFPGQASRFSPLLQALMSKSFPYGVMKRDDALPADLIDDASRFAMDFQPSNLQPLESSGKGWLDPHGLSGSPVWRIGVAGSSAADWSVASAKLVGVVTQWRPDEHLIVAATADAIMNLLQA